MTQHPHDPDFSTSAAALPEAVKRDIAALAKRWKRANGPVMSLISKVGGGLEAQFSALPAGFRDRVESVTARALETSYTMAKHGTKLPASGARGTMAAAMLSGAAGGMVGLPGAIAELPVTITVLLHAIRREAAKAGFDPDDPWIAAEALRTFGSGSPIAADDGINTSFFSARLALSGAAVQKLIATIAPRLGLALSQKLAAQAVPVLGAVSGAALNAAFLRYYSEMAAIRFALLRQAQCHGAGPVLDHFADAAGQPRLAPAAGQETAGQDAAGHGAARGDDAAA